MLKEIIPIVLVLLLQNHATSGKKYLIETKGQGADHTGQARGSRDYQGYDDDDGLPSLRDYHEGGDKKKVNSKDKKQGKDGEDYGMFSQMFSSMFGGMGKGMGKGKCPRLWKSGSQAIFKQQLFPIIIVVCHK